MSEARLRAVIIGCRMGLNHAKAIASLPEFELVGLCDLNADTARDAAIQSGGSAAIYTDFAQMLQEVEPDVAIIATPTGSHARLTIMAAEAGVKAVYCEKPMAVNMGDARKMMEVCEAANTLLIIGHQRRMSAPFMTMRRLIQEGAIGKPRLLRATCAGDFLSDGTHSVDILLSLTGDEKVKWVLAAMFRQDVEPGLPDQYDYAIFTGRRYGHAVESGMMVTLEFESGLRAEFLTGDARLPGSGYQDIEAIGDQGRLWRAGDSANPQLQIHDAQAGGFRAAELDAPDSFNDGLPGVFRQLAISMHTGAHHPLAASIAIDVMEVVMAAYESARLGRRIDLPLQQDRFPLDMMLEGAVTAP
ncbi:Gfo/Idh/MocA family protein [Paenibacillus lignilyticus]|uniref:Gfo/Idh/MocA family oxidoreductase n=1 Tax=Paenibacillus lignilyticus TaxID=1172615 RepID=A0ABS5CFW4_9BACL|nr:Gfo/Idh/MocA family oxidoreductase [Paenibacillus lignilyticus]MBP3964730.1 Gfo/Idh/MocA family oxidoreductase [Paenibacillus lignilyticus]